MVKNILQASSLITDESGNPRIVKENQNIKNEKLKKYFRMSFYEIKDSNLIEEISDLLEDTLLAGSMASKVDFLTFKEKQHYAAVLIDAMQWGRKKDRGNKEYFSKNHLIDKYNI